MLNLPIAMLIWFLVFSVFFYQNGEPPSISSPVEGEVIQDVISITGSTAGTGFLKAEITFGYAHDPTATWFLIQSTTEPVSNNQLALWDTKQITDGDYNLRLQVFYLDNTTQEVIVRDLKIRNTTQLPTQTLESQPSAVSSLSVVDQNLTQVVGLTPIQTPDTLNTAGMDRNIPPDNPASLKESTVYSHVRIGALVSIVVFVVIELILRLRRS